MGVDGRVGERRGNIYIYQKRYQHGQAIQLLSVIMLHDLRVTVCVCSEGSALFHIIFSSPGFCLINRIFPPFFSQFFVGSNYYL